MICTKLHKKTKNLKFGLFFEFFFVKNLRFFEAIFQLWHTMTKLPVNTDQLLAER